MTESLTFMRVPFISPFGSDGVYLYELCRITTYCCFHLVISRGCLRRVDVSGDWLYPIRRSIAVRFIGVHKAGFSCWDVDQSDTEDCNLLWICIRSSAQALPHPYKTSGHEGGGCSTQVNGCWSLRWHQRVAISRKSNFRVWLQIHGAVNLYVIYCSVEIYIKILFVYSLLRDLLLWSPGYVYTMSTLIVSNRLHGENSNFANDH